MRGLWDRLEDAGVATLRSHTHGRHHPHISYVVLRSWNREALCAALAKLGDGPPVAMRFDGVGLFRRGRVWLAPAVGEEFVTRQQRVVDAVVGTGADLHKHYLPGSWLPHCSLAPRVTLGQLPVVAAAVFDVLPLATVLDRAALIDSATGELWPLPALP